MKTLAIAAVAAALSVSATAGNAFASDEFDRAYDATVISIDVDRGVLTLDNGWTLDSSVPHFALPAGAQAGDKVRVNIGGDNHAVTGVRVIG